MASTFKIKPTGKLLSDRGLSSKGRVQQFVDSEVLRLTAPYIPFKTGMLIKSGTLGTVVGTGEVNYIAPYAAKQTQTATSRSYDAQRGGQFFERMKIDHRDEILRGAKKLSGGA